MKQNGVKNMEMKEKLLIFGKVRLIECDGLKYPNFEDVDKAIKNGDAIISKWFYNVIPTVGRTAIARRLVNAGLKANEGIITYGAVGTGTNVAVNSDTKLQTEIARKLCSQRNYLDNTIIIRTFFTTSEANGDLKEFGLFGEDASSTPDSGTLFERVNINKTKTSSKTLTIESAITIS